ncbi:hypothetical protein MY11210_003371 [Beauveria gryllotalpidicola]
MRVIIVGGGIAGLTLANALERAGIDFLVLEARSLLDPQVGASIGLNAASMRIFDQLGIAAEITASTAPIRISKVHRADGGLIMPAAITFQILEKRFLEMTADFNCLFGISDPVDGLTEGEVDTVFDKGRSSLTITGKGGRVYWFYHEKLKKTYSAGAKDFPRYSKTDAQKFALRNAERHVNGTVTLGQLWQARISYALVPLEEALFDKWSWRRIATVGDNAHKMTPNHGQAGNNAVESAAALANQLRRIQEEGNFTTEAIESALRGWQDKRQSRINATVREAAAICRMQALDSRLAYMVMNYIVPNAIETLLSMVTDTLIGAEILEYLPVPAKSLEGSCPFNPSQGTGKHESLLGRIVMTAPIAGFAIAISAFGLANPERLKPQLSADAANSSQSLSPFRFLVDVSLIFSLWLIESHRRANLLTVVRFPTLFFITSLKLGFGIVCPIYYSLHFVFSSIGKFAATDARLSNIAYTRTILPLMLISIGFWGLLSTNELSTNELLADADWYRLDWRTTLWSAIAITIAQKALVILGLSKLSSAPYLQQLGLWRSGKLG